MLKTHCTPIIFPPSDPNRKECFWNTLPFFFQKVFQKHPRGPPSSSFSAIAWNKQKQPSCWPRLDRLSGSSRHAQRLTYIDWKHKNSSTFSTVYKATLQSSYFILLYLANENLLNHWLIYLLTTTQWPETLNSSFLRAWLSSQMGLQLQSREKKVIFFLLVKHSVSGFHIEKYGLGAHNNFDQLLFCSLPVRSLSKWRGLP